VTEGVGGSHDPLSFNGLYGVKNLSLFRGSKDDLVLRTVVGDKEGSQAGKRALRGVRDRNRKGEFLDGRKCNSLRKVETNGGGNGRGQGRKGRKKDRIRCRTFKR